MVWLQYDKTNKELVYYIPKENRQYDVFRHEIHDEIFNALDCMFRSQELISDACAKDRPSDCDFPVGWRIRKGWTKTHYARCDSEKIQPQWYRKR